MRKFKEVNVSHVDRGRMVSAVLTADGGLDSCVCVRVCGVNLIQ